MAKRQNMVEKAYQILSDKILRFELFPGQIVSDHLLCQDLGMSRTPVREALVRLEQDGLVVSCSDRKLMISQAGIKDLVEIYQARMAIESKAVEILLEEGGFPREMIEALERSQEQMRENVARGDLKGNFAADDAFHLTFMEYAGNSRLTDFFKRLRMQSMRARFLSAATQGWLNQSLAEHDRIIQALKAGEGAAITAAVNDHLQSAIRNYRNILGGSEEQMGIANVLLMMNARQDTPQ